MIAIGFVAAAVLAAVAVLLLRAEFRDRRLRRELDRRFGQEARRDSRPELRLIRGGRR